MSICFSEQSLCSVSLKYSFEIEPLREFCFWKLLNMNFTASCAGYGVGNYEIEISLL
jgi:hypothetical protein